MERFTVECSISPEDRLEINVITNYIEFVAMDTDANKCVSVMLTPEKAIKLAHAILKAAEEIKS